MKMERYHIYKLGLAILFYAIYCRRPMIVNALKGNNNDTKSDTTTPVIDDYYYVYYQGVEGLPGVDFPVLSQIPRTTFTCKDIDSGYYADLETDCQVFHICNEGKKVSFLCPNGTIFQQADLICDWWFKVNCTNSPNLYEESAEQLRVDNLRRKESRKVQHPSGNLQYNNNNNKHHHNNYQEPVANNIRRSDPSTYNNRQNSRTSFGKSIHLDSQKSSSNTNENRHYHTNKPTGSNINNRQDNHSNNRNVGTTGSKHQETTSYREHTSSEETQITQETASFVKNKYNSIRDNRKSTSYPNHRQTYSELKDPKNYYTTTQSYSRSFDGYKTTLNNGQPFISTTPHPVIHQTNFKTSNPRVLNENKQKIEVRIVQEQPKVKFVDSRTTIGEILASTAPSNHKPYYQPTTIIDATTISYDDSNKKVYNNYKNNYQATKSTVKSLSSNFDKIELATSYNNNNNNNNKPNAKSSTKSESAITSRTSNNAKNLEFITTPSARASSSFNAVTKTIQRATSPQVSITIPSKDFNGLNNDKTSIVQEKSKVDIPAVSSTRDSRVIKVQSTTPSNDYYSKPIDYSAKYTGGFISNSLSPFNGKDGPSTESNIIRVSIGKSDDELKNYKSPLNKDFVQFITTTQRSPSISDVTIGYASTTGASFPDVTTFGNAQNKVFTTSGDVEATTLGRTPDFAIVTGRYVHDDDATTQDPSSLTTFGRHTYLPTGTNLLGTSAATEQIFGLFTPVPKLIDDYENTGQPKLSSTPKISKILTEDIYVSRSPKIYQPKPFETSTSKLSETSAEVLTSSNSNNLIPIQDNKLDQEINTKLSERYSSTTPTPKYEISSASPFNKPSDTTVIPTEPTPYTTFKSINYNDNVNNMINTLTAILGKDKMHSLTDSVVEDTPRPGLTPPPSAGPQTLLTLANYFASALDDIMSETTERGDDETNKDKIINELLSMNTVDRYKELFDHNKSSSTTEEIESSTYKLNDLKADDSKGLVESPRVRQLAQTFTKALSSYLDNPENFRNTLKDIRPTEPPTVGEEDKDEVLNFSDGDGINKFNLANHFNDVKPTWGFVIGYPHENNLNENKENLQNSDSQSFVSQLNSLNKDVRSTTPTYLSTTTDSKLDGTTAATTTETYAYSSTSTPLPVTTTYTSIIASSDADVKQNLPTNHWTSSPDATKLWQTTLQVNPHSINQKLDLHVAVTSSEETTTESNLDIDADLPVLTTNVPGSTTKSNVIEYTISSLPVLDLNETQVHGLLIDLVNTTKTDDKNRLTRILHKLNTTEDEFLVKMQEIEKNPLTRRLILLLISECEYDTKHDAIHDIIRLTHPDKADTIETSSTSDVRTIVKDDGTKSKASEDQDGRALELLNSLYTIAAKYGK